jgi:hypothetical protein
MLKRRILKLVVAVVAIASAIWLTSLGTQALGATAVPHSATVSHSKTVHTTKTAPTGAVPIKTGASDRPTWCWNVTQAHTCCPYLAICGWNQPDGGGQTRVEYFACETDFSVPNDFTGYGSWINNETAGTHAYFKNRSHTTIYTTPAPTANTPTWSARYNWHPVWYIEACS